MTGVEENRGKVSIAVSIAKTIRQRGVSLDQAAEHFGLKQKNFSDLMWGKLGKFTTDRALR